MQPGAGSGDRPVAAPPSGNGVELAARQRVGPPAERPLPAWRMYLYAVGSFGLYLPYWVWRRARIAGVGGGDRATPVWWAVGALMAPVAWAVLYAMAREADARRPEGAHRMPAGLPAALCLVLSALLLVSPLKLLYFGWLLLVPLPFVLTQVRINAGLRAAGAAPLARRQRSLRLAGTGAAALGVVVVAGALYWFDRGTVARWLTPTLSAADTVRGVSGVYELEVPAGGWRRARPGAISEDAADLELTGPGAFTWLVVYVEEEPVNTIDSTVQFRRQDVFASGRPARYDEERYFLDRQSYAPVSVADYRVDLPLAAPDHYVVLTTRLEEGLVEVVGYTGDPKLYEDLRRLVLSFRSTSSGEASS